MGQLQGPSSHKRKNPGSIPSADSLTRHERTLYDVIKSKEAMGIQEYDLKSETKVPDQIFKESISALQRKILIKEVVNVQNKRKKSKHYMAVEFEPSEEISGGAWYSDGKLDTEFITVLKEFCLKHIDKFKVATLEGITDSIIRSGAFTGVSMKKQQIEEIMKVLVLDNEITEHRSTGSGEFANIPVGKVCYRCTRKKGSEGEQKTGALASIPCGVCPQISLCTPDGIISPKTCVYYTKWLQF